MTAPNFFIYARKSTDDAERQIRSIEDQLAEVRELAAKLNLNVVDVLLEKQSAKRPGRPVFNEMLERLEKGEASGILAWHPDRLARNMLDGGRIIHLVDTGIIKEMRFPTIDFQATSQGKLTLAMLFGMSKYYVDALSENIKRGQRQKLKNGIWPKMTPIGYLNDKKARTIILDPERGPLIKRAFELFATGAYTLDLLTAAMTAAGLTNATTRKLKGRPLSRTQLHRLLQNPFYYGTFRYRGEHYEGKHEPIISKKLFDEVQAVIKPRSRPTGFKYKPYIYRGLFRCGECGCFITSETQKGHNYLHCTKRVKRNCSQPYMREEKVTEQVAFALKAASIPDDWADWIVSQLELDQKNDLLAGQTAEQAFKNEIRVIESKLDRLMIGYLDKLFGPDEYRESKNRLLAEKQDLSEKLNTLTNEYSSRFEPAIRFVNDVKQAKYVAEHGNAIDQRDCFKKVGSNPYFLDRTLRYVPRNAWKLVVDSGRFAHPTSAPSHDGAESVGESDHNHNEAEEQGFEPWRPLRAYRFSRPAHSTTLPLLRRVRGGFYSDRQNGSKRGLRERKILFKQRAG